MRKLVIIIVLSLLSFIQLVSSQSEQLHFLRGLCLKSENVEANSTYNKNTLSLLSTLISSSFDSKFANFSVGTGPDQVNGLYLCRPDINLETCHMCISNSRDKFLGPCSQKKEAILWYDECMIRYTNHLIFSTEEITPVEWALSGFNVSQPEAFPALLNHTMEKLITEIVSPENELRFAIGNASFTAFEKLYGMVICTPDITRNECEHCLRSISGLIPSCCGGLAQWTTVLTPSCQLHYDTAPFIFPSSPPSPVFAPAPAVSQP